MERSFLWKSLQIIARIGTSLLFELKVYGLENVPETGGVLLVANHQSNLDPVLVAVRLRRPVSFLAKSELFEPRFLGWLIRQLHAFPIRQNHGDVGAVREAIRRLEEGNVLNFYPEGTRSENGQMGPLQKGIALVIRKVDVPVVPVAIDGSFAAWRKGDKVFHSHPIHVMFGKPMHFKGMSGEEILQKLTAAIANLLEELKTRP